VENPVTYLQLVSLLLALWLCLPRLLVVFRQNRIHRGFEGGPEEAGRYWLHGIDEQHYQQLAELGFKPLGIYWEKTDFGRKFQEFVYVAPTERCFAMLYPINQILPRRATFLTAFDDGAIVFTKNYQGGVQGDEPTFLAGGLPPPAKTPTPERALPSPPAAMPFSSWKSLLLLGLAAGVVSSLLYGGDWSPSWGVWAAVALTLLLSFFTGQSKGQDSPPPDEPDLDYRAPLKEVLEEHRRRVGRFQLAGRAPLAAIGEDDFLQTQKVYHEHPFVSGVYRSAELFNLCVRLGGLAFAPVLLSFWLGVDHVAVWSVLLAECLVMAAFRYGCSTAFVIGFLRRLGGEQVPPKKPP
jgi:hypothetical protein